MRFATTKIPGVIIVETRRSGDERGYLQETFRQNRFAEAGIRLPFVQENFAHSLRGALRGLHFQHPQAQGKLVQVLYGAIWDVAVDVRRDSATFRQWQGIELQAEQGRLLWVPPGFAHGFCVLSETAGVLYKCTSYYKPEDERAIAWNDPDLGIDWPIGQPILSQRDSQSGRLSELSDLPMMDGP